MEDDAQSLISDATIGLTTYSFRELFTVGYRLKPGLHAKATGMEFRLQPVCFFLEMLFLAFVNTSNFE